MDFFSNIAKGVGGFFNSVFNRDDEEEKRRRQQQQAAQKQRAQQGQKQAQQWRQNTQASGNIFKDNLGIKNSINVQQKADADKAKNSSLAQGFRKLQENYEKAPKPSMLVTQDAIEKEKSRQKSELIVNGRVSPRMNVQLSPAEFKEAMDKRYELNKKPNVALDNAEAIFNAPLVVGKDIAQGMARIPETAGRSLIELLPGDQKMSDMGENTGIRKFLYGDEGIRTYQQQGHDTDESIKEFTDGKVDLPAPLLGVALAALDVGTLGIGKGLGASAKVIAREGAELGLGGIAKLAAKEFAGTMAETAGHQIDRIKSAVDAVKKKVEGDVGRKLTEKEAEELAKRTETAVEQTLKKDKEAGTPNKAGAEVGETATNPTDIPKNEKPTPTNTPKSKDEVIDRYTNIYNQINNDTTLTPAQKVEYLAAAKAEHSKLLQTLDDTTTKNAEVVGKQADEIEGQQQQLADNVADAEQKANDARQPAPEQMGDAGAPPPKDPLDPEVNANNVYDDADDAIQARRDNAESIRDAQDVPLRRRIRNWLGQEIYDPLSVTQREMGEEAANLVMRRNNRGAATRATLRESGIRDLIAKYGRGSDNAMTRMFNPERNQLAADFEDYRIFKDELWRMSPEGGGNKQTINGITPEQMEAFVKRMEKENPDFVTDAAKLREYSLDNMRRRMEAGTESREMYEASARNPFYTPRQQVAPENAVRPTMQGLFNRTGLTTRGRSEHAHNVESPMDMFVKDTEATIGAEADQALKQLAIDQGYNVSVDAGQAALRRDAYREMRKLSDERERLKAALKDKKANQKVVKAEIKGLEDRAVETMRRYFVEQSVDSAGAQAARQMSRDELIDIFHLATETGEVTGKTVSKSLQKRLAQDKNFQGEIDALKGDIKASKEQSADAYQEMLDNITYNSKTGMAEITYKVDGASGKIEIPSEIAKEWSKQDKLFDRTPVGKALDALGNTFKVTWTGTLAPVFQAKQIIMNTGLMFRNADGVSGIDHNAMQGFIQGLLRKEGLGGNDAFRRALEMRGAQFETATQGVILRKNITDDIVDHSGFKEALLRNPIKSAGDFANAVNRAMSHVSNAQRMAVAQGAYKRALRQGFPESQALDIAAAAPAKVFGDFSRVSHLARNLELVIPYSGAMQSGARAMVRASKQKPMETLAKDAIMLSSVAGLVAWNYSQGAAQYYEAMKEQGLDIDAENNIVIAYGNVTQNEDGSWNNLIKIPLTPDFRPLNRAILDTFDSVSKGEGVDPLMMGYELFNYFTGDVTSSLYDGKKMQDPQSNLIADAVIPSSPVANVARTLMNRNTWSGGELADDTMSLRKPEDQAYDSTPEISRKLSALTGGTVTPLQANQIMNMFGSAGQAINKSQEETGDETLERFLNIGKAFTPKAPETDQKKLDTRQYFKDIDSIVSEAAKAGMDDKTINAFKSLHSTANQRSKDNMLNSAARAAAYMEYSGDGAFSGSQLYELEKALDDKARAAGRPGNPLFDLPPEALQAVLTYRSMKIPNAAKQSYSKGGESAFEALGLDNKWYQDFRDAESAYYKAIMGEDDGEDTYKTFSGESKPTLNEEQKAIQNQYFDADKATRRAILANNQWLKDYWAESNGFTDEERKALGFSSLDGDQVYDGNTGSSYGGGGGRRGSRGGRGGFGGGEDRLNTQNVLNDITNEGDSLKRLASLVGKEPDPNLLPQLRKLFAPHEGGRAKVTFGASSRGKG